MSEGTVSNLAIAGTRPRAGSDLLYVWKRLSQQGKLQKIFVERLAIFGMLTQSCDGLRDLLANGEHIYTITYTTSRQLGFFRDHDELFWNATGNGWAFLIEHASATVRLLGVAGQFELEPIAIAHKVNHAAKGLASQHRERTKCQGTTLVVPQRH